MCTSACYYDTYRVLQSVQNAQNYSTGIIPSTGTSMSQNISVSVFLVKLLELSNSGTIHIVVSLILSWNDPRLAWNSSLFNNVTAIQISSDQIWTPKLGLLNSVSENMMITIASNDTMTRLTSTGTIKVSLTRPFKVACSVDLTYFPFDSQTCFLHFYYDDLSYTKFTLLFKLGNVVTNVYKSIGEFKFISAILTVDENKNATYNYSYFYLVVVHDRNPSYYISNVALPVTFLVAALGIVFILPSDNNAKITMSCSLTVALYVLQQAVSRMLPATTSTPLLAKGMVLALGLGLYSLACSIVTVTLFANKPRLSPCVERFVDALERLLSCRQVPHNKNQTTPLPMDSCCDSETKARAHLNSNLRLDLRLDQQHEQATITRADDQATQHKRVEFESPERFDKLTAAVTELVRMKQRKLDRAKTAEEAQTRLIEHARRWKTLDLVINCTLLLLYVIVAVVTCVVFVYGLPS